MNGWGQIRELVVQLRGEAGPRQVPDARRAMWATAGGDALILSAADMAELTAPIVNSLSQPFWDAAEQGRLALPHRIATGQPFGRPRHRARSDRAAQLTGAMSPPPGVFAALSSIAAAFSRRSPTACLTASPWSSSLAASACSPISARLTMPKCSTICPSRLC